jgi:hypothetical protein
MADAVVEVCTVWPPLKGFSWLTALQKALLEGGADPELGSPSALDCIVMFKQEEKWKAKFEAAPGRGKAVATNVA